MTQVFHSDVNNVAPWQATYAFPSQTTKSEKSMIKLQCKNGKDAFVQNDTIRFEFPSDQYLNALNTQISFDLNTYLESAPTGGGVLEVKADGTYVLTIDTTIVTDAKVQGAANNLKGYYIKFTDPYKPHCGNYYYISANSIFVQAGNLWSSTLTIDELGTTTKMIPVGTGYKVYLFNGMRMQDGGAHALFSRIKVSYGGMVIEDIVDYNIISRLLLDVGVSRNFLSNTGGILEGTNCTHHEDSKFWPKRSTGELIVPGDVETQADAELMSAQFYKRMCFRPFVGILNCKKLIPLKWMASSLVIEMTVAQTVDQVISPNGVPLVEIRNPTIMAELLNFDSTYDTGFYYGMQQFGIPLHFTSWHSHTKNLAGTTENIQIHERARSIKMGLAVMRTTEKSQYFDTNRFYHGANGWFKFDTATKETKLVTGLDAAPVPISRGTTKAISEYQWRIGGKYYPAQPVDCTNGGAEAYIELLKTMDALGDYTFSNNIDRRDWHVDYDVYGGNKFVMAGEFENSDLDPNTISGINGEEQSDIMLNVKLENMGTGTFTKKQLHVFVAYDALLIVRPENSVELVM